MSKLHSIKIGIILSLLTLVFGFGMGVVFGLKEDQLKEHIKSKGVEVMETKYNGDPAKLDAVLTKSWTYFKRAHLHANGLGTTALVLILLLAFLTISENIKQWLAIILGVGSLGYSIFWLWAGLIASSLGGTGAAKEALAWLAIPTSGMCIIGLVMVLFFVIREKK